MSPTRWSTVAHFSDTLSAQALLERLVAEGLGARIHADTSLLGAARACRVVVPQEQLHRARWVLSQSQFTDEELAALAAGGSDPDAP